MNGPTEPKEKRQSPESEAISLTFYSLVGFALIMIAIYFMTL